MLTLLLVIIYISFISLGLPDPLLGSAWPAIHGDLGIPMAFAGVASMIVSCGTVVSSLLSVRVIKRFGTGLTTAVSVAMTAGALLGFSAAPSFFWLCLLAVPLGLGAGAVDAALNNFVALHYKARHMSWLHCFWGIGASVGPYIMGACLTGGLPWTGGYRIISVLQIGLTAVLFATLYMWKGSEARGQETGERKTMGFWQVFRLSGAKEAMVSFFCYCALEQTAGLWAASYMVLNRGISASAAAKWASLFYLGITAGRFVCGFITMKLNDRNMVRLGQAVTAGGIVLLMLPLSQAVTGVGLVMVGVGCAPVYPALLHETPANFGEDLSQAIMGMQMACAYVGTMVMPSLFGMISGKIGIWLYPFYLLVITGVMVLMVERLNRLKKTADRQC